MTPSNRDWPEDFELNNGNYFCRCCLCSEQFTGHKRRVICKLCAQAQPAPAEVAQGEAVDVFEFDHVKYGQISNGWPEDAIELIDSVPTEPLITVSQHNRIVASMVTPSPDAELVGLRTDTTPATFALGDRVQKKSGSQWAGKVVGWYSTSLTPEGYAVESESHAGSVQIYPANALKVCDE
jgi:hypothetical protein